MTESELPEIVRWVTGGLLLAFGRRLYWLFTGLVGFVVGYGLGGTLLGDAGPEWTGLLLGLLLGAFAALLAVFFQKVAVVIAGFLAGGLLVLYLAGQGGYDGVVVWLVAVVGGLAGAAMARALFEFGLIVLSSLLGSALVVGEQGWRNIEPGMLFLLVAGAGVVFQLATSGRRKRSKDD